MVSSQELRNCPSTELLLTFRAGDGESIARRALEQHLEQCSRCEETLARIASTSDAFGYSGDHTTPLLSRGTRLGRYVVEEPIGRGATGMVYRAVDSELHRPVAIKLLSTPNGSDQRLAHEAQALARLSHPHIVSVFDVGRAGARFYLALEYMAGGPLSDWVTNAKPPSREILRAMLQAGSGIQAAHEAGFIHRDVKPDNILLTERGEAKITDFELSVAPTDESRSQVGVAARHIVGTLAFMPPEQFASAGIDARADQYAFCCSAWWALTKRLPYTPQDSDGLAPVERWRRAKLHGPPAWPPGIRVPRRVRNALRRGLSPRPEDRFASMQQLLDAIRPVGNRRVSWVLGIAAVAAVSTAVGYTRFQSSQRLRACVEEIGALSVATIDPKPDEPPGLAQPRSRWIEGLAAYRVSWSEQRDALCRQLAEREVPISVAGQRSSCLAESRAAYETATGLLDDFDADLAWRVDEILGSLPAPRTCAAAADRQDAGAGPTASPSVRQALARAETLLDAGRFDDVVTVVGDLELDLEAETDAAARANLLLGSVHIHRHEWSQAAVVLRRALNLGLRTSTWTVAAGAGAGLIHVEHRVDEGPPPRALVEVVGALTSRPGVDPQLEVDALISIGLVHMMRGESEASAQAYGDALALGMTDPSLDVCQALHNLAVNINREGKTDDALRVYEQTLSYCRSRRDEDHPDIVRTLLNVGNLLVANRRYDEALAYLQRAKVSMDRVQTSDTLERGFLLGLLALTQLGRGRLAQARELQEAALEILEGRAEPHHVAGNRATLARILAKQGFVADAIAELETVVTTLPAEPKGAQLRAATAVWGDLGWLLCRLHDPRGQDMLRRVLEHRETALGADHPYTGLAHEQLAICLAEGPEALARINRAIEVLEPRASEFSSEYVGVLHTRGKLLARSGRTREALRDLEQARSWGREHEVAALRLARVDVDYSRALARSGRSKEALAVAQGAWAVLEESTPANRAAGAFALAEQLGANGSTERARALASQAEAIYAGFDPPHRELASVEAWIERVATP